MDDLKQRIEEAESKCDEDKTDAQNGDTNQDQNQEAGDVNKPNDGIDSNDSQDVDADLNGQIKSEVGGVKVALTKYDLP